MSWGKGLFLILLLVGGAAGALYWFNTRPEVWQGEQGYTIDVPQGWEMQTVDSGLTCFGIIAGGGTGRATFHPHHSASNVTWPDDAKRLFPMTPATLEETLIDERRAVLATWSDESNTTLGTVVDRGDGMIFYVLSCSKSSFDENRRLFERCARGIRCFRK